MSPTLLRQGPYRFHFYAGDGAEPPHVHIAAAGKQEAKIWLTPVRVAQASGYSPREVRIGLCIVQEHREQFLIAWHEFFRPKP